MARWLSCRQCTGSGTRQQFLNRMLIIDAQARGSCETPRIKSARPKKSHVRGASPLPTREPLTYGAPAPMHHRLSTKPIPPRDRLIVALDVPTVQEAKALVDTLNDVVSFYKIGLELFMANGYY